MRVKRLTLTNVRAFQQAEFEFQPGMNLLVGVNGAGKSTVLEVLRRMFARWLRGSTKAPIAWSRDEDIRLDQEFMAIDAQLDFYGQSLTYSYQLQRRTSAEKQETPGGRVITYTVQEIDELRDEHNRVISGLHFAPYAPPLAVFYSPHRSVSETRRQPSGSTKSRANNLALEPRGLNVQELAQWWLAQVSLHDDSFGKQLSIFGDFSLNLGRALNDAIHGFLETYGDIYPVSEPKPTIKIAKGDMVLDVLQLSDGERSMIALVIDLARRLALASPGLEDPLSNGRAVVLIDEIDLHLHPAWQRKICERLTSTFPNCQFIATTHSPQIVGEVSADRIWMIDDGKLTRPDQSKGMESGWILRELMDVSSRREEIRNALERIETLIEENRLSDAKTLIAQLRSLIPDDPELARLQTRLNITELMRR